MDEQHRFPVLYLQPRPHEPDEWAGCPKDIPWSLVEAHESQAHVNHGQTLARLAERGGLSPCELYAVIHGRRWKADPLQSSELRQWLVSLPTLDVSAKSNESIHG